MKNISRSFLKVLVFLVMLFVVQRLVFVLFFAMELKKFSLLQILLVFIYSLPMDVATGAGVLILFSLFLIIKLFATQLLMDKVVRYTMVIVIFLSWLITAADIALYESWGTRINSKALSYLTYPGEAIKSSWSSRYFFLILILVCMIIFSYKIFKKIFSADNFSVKRSAGGILFTCLSLFVLIVVMRGGFQEFPLGKSWVYFSPHASLNQAALNSVWNFGYALTQPAEPDNNPYRFFTEEHSNKIVAELHAASGDSVIIILNSPKPNILVVMMESWSDSITKREVNGKKITPAFERISREGLLFTNFYSPGFRTEQGLAALVSGFPSQPATSIVRKYGVFDRLPGLPKSLSEAGYVSSFYYGGSLHFANTNGYLKAMGFEKITGDETFSESKRTGWGIYDEELFRYFVDDIKKSSQPFFSMVLSCTSHEPFDADVERIVPHETGSWCNDYVNTIHYSDQCLGIFIEEIKKLPWYENTLVVITGDHGQECSDRTEYNSAERHHIPFLLTGGALKDEFKGKTFSPVSSQVDFASSFLTQLELPANEYRWSKNVFNPASRQFAFYAFDDGFGWISDSSEVIYDNKMQKAFLKNDSKTSVRTDKEVNYGKAYLQVLMDEYISFSGKK
ncbi:MAG TPA: sulfatase-like hydrolase/transferase [Bacteroidia bacterium]|nr:sulfatase-like hydrolase/transferase [Bacteroidia bacterium]